MICQDGWLEHDVSETCPGTAGNDTRSATIEVVGEPLATGPIAEIGIQSHWSWYFNDHHVTTFNMDDVAEPDTSSLEVSADALDERVAILSDDSAWLILEVFHRQYEFDIPDHGYKRVIVGIDLFDVDSASSIGLVNHLYLSGVVGLLQNLEAFIADDDVI